MKIIDAIPNTKSYKLQYIGKRTERNEDGSPVMEHGRSITEDVTTISKKTKVSFRFLVQRQTKDGPVSEWHSEAELVNLIGKKKYKQMYREFVNRVKTHKDDING